MQLQAMLGANSQGAPRQNDSNTAQATENAHVEDRPFEEMVEHSASEGETPPTAGDTRGQPMATMARELPGGQPAGSSHPSGSTFSPEFADPVEKLLSQKGSDQITGDALTPAIGERGAAAVMNAETAAGRAADSLKTSEPAVTVASAQSNNAADATQEGRLSDPNAATDPPKLVGGGLPAPNGQVNTRVQPDANGGPQIGENTKSPSTGVDPKALVQGDMKGSTSAAHLSEKNQGAQVGTSGGNSPIAASTPMVAQTATRGAVGGENLAHPSWAQDTKTATESAPNTQQASGQSKGHTPPLDPNKTATTMGEGARIGAELTDGEKLFGKLDASPSEELSPRRRFEARSLDARGVEAQTTAQQTTPTPATQTPAFVLGMGDNGLISMHDAEEGANLDFRLEALSSGALRDGTQTAQAAQMTRAYTPASIVGQIAEAARVLPNRPVEISLSPEELGKVKLTFQVSENGALNVVVAAEKLETVDLMKRNISMLSEEFAALGYEGSSFTFSNGTDTGGGNADTDAGDSGAFSDIAREDIGPVADPSRAPMRLALNDSTRLDVRI